MMMASGHIFKLAGRSGGVLVMASVEDEGSTPGSSSPSSKFPSSDDGNYRIAAEDRTRGRKRQVNISMKPKSHM